MGWGDGNHVRLGPCPNCGKRDGYMGSSAWTHGYMVCSEQCGVRLGHRIRYGFKPGLALGGGGVPWFDTCDPHQYAFPQEPSALRIEIKKLRHRLRHERRERAKLKLLRIAGDTDA